MKNSKNTISDNSIKREKALYVVSELKRLYPDAQCALQYNSDPWRLLIMGRLSAQCTDKRVNEVCVELFEKFPDCTSMANGNMEKIESLIFSCGLYKTKAKSIKELSQKIISDYNGIVPDTMEALLTLPGVGRKIANLILGDIYGKPAIVADTHCIRISARLGLCGENGMPVSPASTEKQLSAVIPPQESSSFCHRLVLFGRDICSSRSPKCDNCVFRNICIHHTNFLNS